MEIFSKVLYGDPFKEEIVKYLDPKDLYNIKYVSKDFYGIITFKMIKDTINLCIYQRLQKILGDHTDKFLELLSENSGVISGSFLLQCILNETYTESDIDIYIPIPYYETQAGSFTSIENYIYNIMKGKYITSSYQYEPENIAYIREYHFNVKLQIIYIISKNPLEDLWKTIRDLYDFDILKNIYSSNALKIHKLSDIMTKSTTFGYTWSLKASIIRYNKYINRGITFKEPIDARYVDLLFKSREYRFVKVIKIDDGIYKYLNRHKSLSKLALLGTSSSLKQPSLFGNIIKDGHLHITTENIVRCEDYCPLK